ncbi:MAG: hypothetical protein M1594_01970 [Candidatus Marsarchaeota archaeon]|nr:hypothetical protein [Candidatus Marsarchaeota archaeon]
MEQMNEDKRRETLKLVVSENLPPMETINFIFNQNQESKQRAKEMAEVSIDNALFTLNEKKQKGFFLSNYNEFSNFYENHFQSAPTELKNHVQEYLERKMLSGEMEPLSRKIEFEQKQTPDLIISRMLFNVFNDEMKKKIRIAIETGGNEQLYKEIKDKVLQNLRENVSDLAEHDYSINLNTMNNQIQINARVPGWMESKLKLDDRQNELSILNTLIKNKAFQLKHKQESVKKEEVKTQKIEPEEKPTLTLADLGLKSTSDLQEVQDLTSESEEEKPEAPKSIEPSMDLFLETFFKKENKSGKLLYTKIKNDIANGGGRKVEGKRLYEKARDFIKIYAQYHQIKKYEANPNLLKNEEKTKNFFVSEHRKLIQLIKKIKSRNPQNTPNPQDLEAYFNISSALNILHSRLSEFTTPYMKSKVSVA